VVTLLGANGAGKSTTLRAISGLGKAGGGRNPVHGKSIAGLGPETMSGSHLPVPGGGGCFPASPSREKHHARRANRRIAKSALSRRSRRHVRLVSDIRSFSNALGLDLVGRAIADWSRCARVDGEAAAVAAGQPSSASRR